MTQDQMQRLAQVREARNLLAKATQGCTANKRAVTRVKRNTFRNIDALESELWNEFERQKYETS